MARFVLYVNGHGTMVPNEEGIEVAGIEAARQAALDAARDVMAEEVRSGYLCMDDAICK